MDVALVYNGGTGNVLYPRGVPTQERLGRGVVGQILDALRDRGHDVVPMEGDIDLVARLRDRFGPGPSPPDGIVLNLAYGIQGAARYTQVPAMLEMAGMPYTGSGPQAHAVCLDKQLTKALLGVRDVPTPAFKAVGPGDPLPDMAFPLIVKPQNEASSLGLRLVHDRRALREAVDAIHHGFRQPALVERYIEGREINIAVIGNDPPEALPAVELDFGGGARIYTHEDKVHASGRIVEMLCPAPIEEDERRAAERIALRAFRALDCYDLARVDMRMDEEGRFYVLEVNSLAALGGASSVGRAAQVAGMDLAGLLDRIVQVAWRRWFGPTKKVPEEGPITAHPGFVPDAPEAAH